MAHRKLDRLRWYVAALGALFALAMLAWEYTHGGVVSHHFLDRRDMPTVSNWWSLAVLPLLGWLAGWSARRGTAVGARALPKAFAGGFGALLVGVAIAVTFTTGHQQVTGDVFFAALASGVVLPTYRAEYVFGFVLGMAFAFGAVLPTLFALIGVAISATFHLLVRPVFARVIRRARA
ncbi:MAG TPA: hypothetical protein VJ862_02080 [Rhodanobacteraceae bacterium]|nr:hypothetical protein [Rhodanobacteraceae bacterium]